MIESLDCKVEQLKEQKQLNFKQQLNCNGYRVKFHFFDLEGFIQTDVI